MGNLSLKKVGEKHVLHACVCLLVQMNDKDIVTTLLEKNMSHLFHAHLFLSTIHISLQHVDISVPSFVADWHPSVCK